MEERVQKIIAAAGITSRRQAEQLILEGRVRVNGQVVTEMGVKADPDKDHIKVDGKLINPKQPPTYIMLNKPLGHVTTMADPEGRPMVSDLLKGVRTRVYPVGRLDYNTEGLLLLTNDGDFAHLVTHPSHELPKSYLVKVKGVLEDRDIEMLEKGVFLQDGKTAPARVRRLRKEEANSWVEITIHEGRKRQVRRMIDHTGHSVIKLKRIRVGNLELGDLPVGTYRHLTADEVTALRELAHGPVRSAVVPTEAPVRRSGSDWKRMEVEAIPGPVKRERKPLKARPAAGSRRPKKDHPRGEERLSREGRTWTGRAQRPEQARQQPGERRPWRAEKGAERPAFQRRGPSSRAGAPVAGERVRPRQAGKGSYEGATKRPEERRPWKGERGTGKPAFPRRGPDPRTMVQGTGGGFRPRQTMRRELDERAQRPGQRMQRPEGRKPWAGGKAAAQSFEGARRPFVKKGPRPAGGPRSDERRGGFAGSRAGSRERTGSRGAWQGEKGGGKPSFGASGRFSAAGGKARGQGGTFPSGGRRSSFSAPAQRSEGKRPWKASGVSARPGTRGTGRASGGMSGNRRPGGPRPPRGRR